MVSGSPEIEDALRFALCSRDVALELADNRAVVAGDVAKEGTTMAQSVVERATECSSSARAV
jgi:hypothetical protein